MILAGAITVGFVGGHASAEQRTPTAEHVYVVRAGDTLWGIAQRQVGPGGDPRQAVQDLIRRNHVPDGAISVGQRLVLPGA